jgi:hypothetical protein
MNEPNGQPPRRSEVRQQIVDATLKLFKQKHALTPEHILVERAKEISRHVANVIDDVLRSPAAGPYNAVACSGLTNKLFLDGFAKWDKDELLFLVCLIHTELAIERTNDRVRQGLYGGDGTSPLITPP